MDSMTWDLLRFGCVCVALGIAVSATVMSVRRAVRRSSADTVDVTVLGDPERRHYVAYVPVRGQKR